MTTKVINTVKHYKIRKNGSLKFVGNEHVEVAEHHWGHIESLDLRDEADAIRSNRESENFEALVDAACGE